MRIKFIEQILFRMRGNDVPIVRCMDIDENGKINTLHFMGSCKEQPNMILSTWDGKGWEKNPKNGGPIMLINEKGVKSLAYAVSEAGTTITLYTKIHNFPNSEEVLGKLAMSDILAMALDLGKSMKNILIGAILSAPVWWIIFQVIGAMAK
jgi:hypothetical protein